MPISPIQFTCPCIPSSEKQTSFSRNYRISCLVAAILLLGMSVLIAARTFPISIQIEWVTMTAALILFALGTFTRCVGVKQKIPLRRVDSTKKESMLSTVPTGRTKTPSLVQIQPQPKEEPIESDKTSLEEAALYYAGMGNTPKFLEVIENPDYKGSEAILSGYIEECFNKENYFDAYKLIKKMGSVETRKAAYDQLVQLVVKGSKTPVMALLHEIPARLSEAEDAFFAKLAQDFFDRQKLELVKKLIDSLFQNTCISMYVERGAPGLNFDRDRKKKIEGIYPLVIEQLADRKASEAFKIIRAEAREFTLNYKD